MSQTTGRNPRWDFSDIILGGPSGKTFSVKNLNPASDIGEHRDDILNEIFRGCLEKTFDGGDKYSMTATGPVGKVVLKDFAYEYKDEEVKELVRFRVSVQQSVKGIFFCMRKINGEIPTLQQQGYNPKIIGMLMQKNRRGLVLFGGEMGVGKTSAASAMISQWLQQNAGSAVTLEDPPEYALQGHHYDPALGDDFPGGLCLQRATTTDTMAKEIPSLMRAAAPEIIFLGEIREENVAREAVLAAANGHLIVSTIHGKGVNGAISRLISLGSTVKMGFEETTKTIADALSMVIFQELIRDQRSGTKILKTSVLDINNPNNSNAIRTILRQGKFEQLDNYIQCAQGKSSL